MDYKIARDRLISIHDFLCRELRDKTVAYIDADYIPTIFNQDDGLIKDMALHKLAEIAENIGKALHYCDEKWGQSE